MRQFAGQKQTSFRSVYRRLAALSKRTTATLILYLP